MEGDALRHAGPVEGAHGDDGIDEPAARTAGGEPVRHPVTFTGTGAEYFRIWIVNLALTILTLYVYSAWAKVRARRWFARHTVIDGSGFDYHARPGQLVVGRMIGLALVLAVALGGSVSPLISGGASLLLLVALPWLTYRSLRFDARMRSWRNVRFDLDGGAGPFVRWMIGAPALVSLAIGLPAFAGFASGYPWAGVGIACVAALLLLPVPQAGLARHVVNHHRYGTRRFAATLRNRDYLAIYLTTLLMGALTALVSAAVVVAAAALIAWVSGVSAEAIAAFLERTEADPLSAASIGATVAVYAWLLLVTQITGAWYRMRVRNLMFERARLAGVAFESRFGVASLAGLLLVNLVMMILTLGIFWPWAKVRVARYAATRTTVVSAEPLDGFVDARRPPGSALGEELGDAFDAGFDFGV